MNWIQEFSDVSFLQILFQPYHTKRVLNIMWNKLWLYEKYFFISIYLRHLNTVNVCIERYKEKLHHYK